MELIERIAHRLALQCRYNGDCYRLYSVAEHSVHMTREAIERGASPTVALAVLLHDAPEHVTGDLVPDVKKHPEIAPVIDYMEERQWQYFIDVLRVPAQVQRIAKGGAVKMLDRAIMAAESVSVAFPQMGWAPYSGADELHVAFLRRIGEASEQHENHPFTHWRDEMVDLFRELVVRA